MEMTTYKMNKTLQQAESGELVDPIDFIQAVNEKKLRKERKSKSFQKNVKKVFKNENEEKQRNQAYRDILEKKVKFCPKCGYKTVVQNHQDQCVRMCKQCLWKSKPWKFNGNSSFTF